jgi:Bacterial protein of unknown function (DUF882)
MNKQHLARAMTRALWVGGIAAVALGASSGARRAEAADTKAFLSDSAGSASSASLANSDGAATSLVAGIPRDTVYGRSGKLRVRFVSARRGTFAIPILTRLFGDSAVRNPGVYALPDSAADQPISFVTLLPFETKVKGTVGSYRIGYWPEERGRLRSEAYENPDGFVVVTPENQDLQISEHFRLRDFLTHDQQGVWPKYMVLEDALVDKLELVIQDLEAHGIPVEHMTVMSGFRTPQYNAQGVGRKGGRAKDSRHQFGDAADVFVDNNRDGRMDDLNHDRRVDSRDAKVIVAAVERVERAYPELAGGGGIYRATRAHGPFAHIDARGWRARWSRS